MNKQPIEKQELREDGSLWVHSIFYTIQGEGPFAGTPAVFVRLAGCNLQCPGCDTAYSDRRLMTVQEIYDEVCGKIPLPNRFFKPLIVITGGEPFRQNISHLIHKIIIWNMFFVQIETNGSLPPQHPDSYACAQYFYNCDLNERRGAYIVCSPKTGKIHDAYNDVACAFKYVMSYDSVDHIDDLPLRVLGHSVKEKVARQNRRHPRPIYLQPMDHTMSGHPLYEDPDGSVIMKNSKSLEAVKQSCLKHGYILQLQIHKIIGVE